MTAVLDTEADDNVQLILTDQPNSQTDLNEEKEVVRSTTSSKTNGPNNDSDAGSVESSSTSSSSSGSTSKECHVTTESVIQGKKLTTTSTASHADSDHEVEVDASSNMTEDQGLILVDPIEKESHKCGENINTENAKTTGNSDLDSFNDEKADATSEADGAPSDRKGEEENDAKMELDVAMEALENMRRANLVLEFGPGVDFTACIQCLRLQKEREERLAASKPKLKKALSEHQTVLTDEQIEAMTDKIDAATKWVEEKRKQIGKRKVTKCFICNSPVCKKHSDEDFRKKKITCCNGCAPVFSLDFLLDCMKNPNIDYCPDDTPEVKEKKDNMKRMLELYDRALLELKHSSQSFDEIAHKMQQTKKVSNTVGLGSCLTSMSSGVTGLVAAALFFTPAGPPMVLASLCLGGAATAITSGNHWVEQFSKDHQTANKNIALAAMMNSLLEATSVLRDARSLTDDSNNMEFDESEYHSDKSDSFSDEDDEDGDEFKSKDKAAATANSKSADARSTSDGAAKASNGTTATDVLLHGSTSSRSLRNLIRICQRIGIWAVYSYANSKETITADKEKSDSDETEDTTNSQEKDTGHTKDRGHMNFGKKSADFFIHASVASTQALAGILNDSVSRMREKAPRPATETTKNDTCDDNNDNDDERNEGNKDSGSLDDNNDTSATPASTGRSRRWGLPINKDNREGAANAEETQERNRLKQIWMLSRRMGRNNRNSVDNHETCNKDEVSKHLDEMDESVRFFQMTEEEKEEMNKSKGSVDCKQHDMSDEQYRGKNSISLNEKEEDLDALVIQTEQEKQEQQDELAEVSKEENEKSNVEDEQTRSLEEFCDVYKMKKDIDQHMSKSQPSTAEVNNEAFNEASSPSIEETDANNNPRNRFGALKQPLSYLREQSKKIKLHERNGTKLSSQSESNNRRLRFGAKLSSFSESNKSHARHNDSDDSNHSKKEDLNHSNYSAQNDNKKQGKRWLRVRWNGNTAGKTDESESDELEEFEMTQAQKKLYLLRSSAKSMKEFTRTAIRAAKAKTKGKRSAETAAAAPATSDVPGSAEVEVDDASRSSSEGSFDADKPMASQLELGEVYYGKIVKSNARFAMKTSITFMQQFAYIVGGAFSAGVICMEAVQLKNTIDQMKAGNQCEKAETLNSVKKEVSKLPDTNELAEAFFQASSKSFSDLDPRKNGTSTTDELKCKDFVVTEDTTADIYIPIPTPDPAFKTSVEEFFQESLVEEFVLEDDLTPVTVEEEIAEELGVSDEKEMPTATKNGCIKEDQFTPIIQEKPTVKETSYGMSDLD